jgi:large subunit ribosomal protein L9
MQVILVERIKDLGNIGDVVRVKDGYARNFLLPQNKAQAVTEENIKSIESRRAALEETERQKHDDAVQLSEKLSGLVLVASSKASDDGKLYGSITASRIVELLSQQGVALNDHHVVMPKEPMRLVGEYTVTLSLYMDVHCDITVQVVAEAKS